MLACYVLTLCDFHVWCLTLTIHEMTAINEITAKIDHVPFTYNWFIVLRKWAHRRMLLQKRCFVNISIFQKILASATESISRKGSTLKPVNVFWKRTLPQFFFLYCDINQFKTLKMPSSLIDQERFFLFLWLFLMKGAAVQHSYIM